MFGSIYPEELGDHPSFDDLQGSYSTWFLNKVFDGEGSSNAFNLEPNRFVASAPKDMKRKSSIDAPFNDDPSELPISDSTSLLNIDSLPAGALNVYYEVGPPPIESPLTSSVFAAEYGSGRIAFLGFDWFTDNLAERAQWNQVLE